MNVSHYDSHRPLCFTAKRAAHFLPLRPVQTCTQEKMIRSWVLSSREGRNISQCSSDLQTSTSLFDEHDTKSFSDEEFCDPLQTRERVSIHGHVANSYRWTCAEINAPLIEERKIHEMMLQEGRNSRSGSHQQAENLGYSYREVKDRSYQQKSPSGCSVQERKCSQAYEHRGVSLVRVRWPGLSYEQAAIFRYSYNLANNRDHHEEQHQVEDRTAEEQLHEHSGPLHPEKHKTKLNGRTKEKDGMEQQRHKAVINTAV